MSKNGQMLSDQAVVIGASRPTVGAAGAAQGVYGARGNLELVACDVADGMWVFWFNADLETDPIAAPDVPPGAWSGGLHCAAGMRYTAAQILQSHLGPDHLEMLALDDGGVLQSWYWSPELAFSRRPEDAARDVVHFVAHEAADGTLAVDYQQRGAGRRRSVAGPDEYPMRSWVDSHCDEPFIADADASLQAVGIRNFQPGTARVSHSTRNGGTREFTYRDAAGALRHLPVPLE